MKANTSIRVLGSLGSLGMAALLAACGAMAPSGLSAVATLVPTKGNTAAGIVNFQQRGDKVLVEAKLSGLQPNSIHGFHVHDKGDCSSGDGMGTAGHFNPHGKSHGSQDAEHHAGDMPALQADANGNAQATFTLQGATIGAGPADLLGRGVIVHAGPDDYKTQPTGNSGARVACGVIRAA